MSAEVTEPTNEERAMSILQPHIDNGETDEETLIVALIQEGSFKFGPATRLLKACLENAGLRISPKDRQEKIDEMLSEIHPFEEWAQVASFAESASEEIDDTTAGQALKCVRAFYKKHEVELPEKPKGAKGGGNRVNALDRFGAWLAANKQATDDEIKGFAATITEKEKQIDKHATRFIQVANIARAFAA